MTTNRTPIQRRPTVQVTKRAIELYVAMGKLRCTCPQPKPPTHSPCPGCERWYDLHNELHIELHCKPWEWPCVVPKTPSMAGSSGPPLSDPGGKATLARMAALDEAVTSLEAEEEKTKEDSMQPVRLSEDQLNTIIAASTPLPPDARGAFLETCAREISALPMIGDGSLHRLVMIVQRRYFRPPLETEEHGRRGVSKHARELV